MCSGGGTRALPRVGFPIRKSSDQSLVSSSPGLIAAAHVLHRLQVPRHPPCALVHLIFRREHHEPLWSFQGARGLEPAVREKRIRPPVSGRAVSQNSAVWPGRGPNAGVDVDSRRARGWTARMPINSAGARGGWSHRIPRKEVIQPQLPLRLPCYDFTPITNSTFGRCLPCGLAHGLRVFPAFVV
jgi:hypothetical protein